MRDIESIIEHEWDVLSEDEQRVLYWLYVSEHSKFDIDISKLIEAEYVIEKKRGDSISYLINEKIAAFVGAKRDKPKKIFYQEYFYVTMKEFPEVGWGDFRNVRIGEGKSSKRFLATLMNDPRELMVKHGHYIDHSAIVPRGTFEVHVVRSRAAAEQAVKKMVGVIGVKSYEYRWRRNDLRNEYALKSFEMFNRTDEWKALKHWEQMKWIEEDIQKQYALADEEWEKTKPNYVEIGLLYPVWNKEKGEYEYK